MHDLTRDQVTSALCRVNGEALQLDEPGRGYALAAIADVTHELSLYMCDYQVETQKLKKDCWPLMGSPPTKGKP